MLPPSLIPTTANVLLIVNEDVWNEENNEIGNDMNGPNRDKLIVAVTEDGYVYEYQCYFDTKPKVIRIDNY